MTPTTMRYADRLRKLVVPFHLARLVASPRGRAFQLSFMADAEESDEGVFDEMLSRVPDADVQKMIRMHRDDERRHARLFRECVARTGVRPDPVPDELRIIKRIDRLVGGGVEAFLANPSAGVMGVYAMLQVVEQRGVEQFPAVAHALRRVDPESAAVVDEITRDERRHVRYAQAIAKRYAPDAETLETTLGHCRAIEAQAFAEHGRAFLRFAVEHDLLAVRGPERLLWRALVAVADPRTPEVDRPAEAA